MKGHPPAHTPARSLAVKVLVLVNVVALVVFLAATRSMQREVRDEMKFESEKRMGMERASPPRVRARPATPAPPSWYRARRWRHHLLERGREEVRARYAIPALSRLSTAPSFLADPPPPPPHLDLEPPSSLSFNPAHRRLPARHRRPGGSPPGRRRPSGRLQRPPLLPALRSGGGGRRGRPARTRAGRGAPEGRLPQRQVQPLPGPDPAPAGLVGDARGPGG